jgi:hypothetical protein
MHVRFLYPAVLQEQEWRRLPPCSAFSFERREENTQQFAPDFSFPTGKSGWQARFSGDLVSEPADAQGAFPGKG